LKLLLLLLLMMIVVVIITIIIIIIIIIISFIGYHNRFLVCKKQHISAAASLMGNSLMHRAIVMQYIIEYWPVRIFSKGGRNKQSVSLFQ